MNVFVLIVMLQMGPYDINSAVVHYFANARPCLELAANPPPMLAGYPVIDAVCEKRIAI
jgi:hypothetical protein